MADIPSLLPPPTALATYVPLKLYRAGGLGPAEEFGRRGAFAVNGVKLMVQFWTEAEWQQIPPGARPAGCQAMEPDGYYVVYEP